MMCERGKPKKASFSILDMHTDRNTNKNQNRSQPWVHNLSFRQERIG